MTICLGLSLKLYGTKPIKERFPPLRLVWGGSPLVWFILGIIKILRPINVYTYIELYYTVEKIYYDRPDENVPPHWTEIWVVFLLFLQILCFIYYNEWPNSWNLFVIYYGLYNISLFAVIDLLEAPAIKKYETGIYCIEIRNPVRWLLLSIVNVAQIVVCFSLLFLVYGNQSSTLVIDRTTAVYKSLLTFTTIGPGEPICNSHKLIVIFELSIFLIFLVLKLPVVLSAFNVAKNFEELSGRLEYRWKQLVVTILNDFDEWVEQLQQKGKKVKYEKKVDDFDVVVDIDKTKYWEKTVREIRFPNGNAISVNFGPGQIQRGKFLTQMNMNFQEEVEGRYQSAFLVWYYEDHARIFSTNKRYKQIEASSRNPLEDQKYLDAISDDFNMIFENMLFFKNTKMDNQEK